MSLDALKVSVTVSAGQKTVSPGYSLDLTNLISLISSFSSSNVRHSKIQSKDALTSQSGHQYHTERMTGFS